VTEKNDNDQEMQTSSLQASELVIEFHATEAYSNLGLTRVHYTVRRLWSEEKENVTVWINPSSPKAWGKMLSTPRSLVQSV